MCQRRRRAAVWSGEGVGACAREYDGGSVEKPVKERRAAEQRQAGVSEVVPHSTINTSLPPEPSVSRPSRGQHGHQRTCKTRAAA